MAIKHSNTKGNPFNKSTLGTAPSLVQEMDYQQLFSNLEVNYLVSALRAAVSTDLSWDCGPIVKHYTSPKIKSPSLPYRVHSLNSNSDKGRTISHICRWEAEAQRAAGDLAQGCNRHLWESQKLSPEALTPSPAFSDGDNSSYCLSSFSLLN